MTKSTEPESFDHLDDKARQAVHIVHDHHGQLGMVHLHRLQGPVRVWDAAELGCVLLERRHHPLALFELLLRVDPARVPVDGRARWQRRQPRIAAQAANFPHSDRNRVTK